MWALAFPRWSVAGLAWIAPGLMLLSASGATPKTAFRLGYAAGLAHYLTGLHWLLFMPVDFFPFLGWVALCLYLSLYPALWVWFCWRLFPRRTPTTSVDRGLDLSFPEWSDVRWTERAVWALLCAAGWVAWETIQARLFSGFPWNLLGASQSSMVLLTQIASYTGVYGVSFLVVWTSVSLWQTGIQLVRSPSARLTWQRELFLPIIAIVAIAAYGWQQLHRPPPAASELRVALLQPSIPQTMIWDENASSQRLAKLFQMARTAMDAKPDLLVWPEAALPYPIRYEADLHLALSRVVTNSSTWMIFGSDDVEITPITAPTPGTNYYNCAFLMNPRGELAGRYAKRQLVIFGEYVPLVKWLPFLRWFTPISGGFASGEERVSFEIPHLRLRLSPLICFEDMFATVVRDQAQEDVQLLLNITNDGWFGESAQQWQHTANASLRAIENGIPLVRCANNGITCWVDPQGRVFGTGFDSGASPYGEGIKHFRIPVDTLHSTSRTFYRRYGDVFGWSCTLLIGGLAAWSWRRLFPPGRSTLKPSA